MQVRRVEGWPSEKPHAHQHARHPEGAPSAGGCLHRHHHGPAGRHHLRERGVHPHQRVHGGGADRAAPQPGPAPGHAAGRLRGSVAHGQGRQGLAGHGEEPLQERGFLLGGRQRDAHRGEGADSWVCLHPQQTHAVPDRGSGAHVRQGPGRAAHGGPGAEALGALPRDGAQWPGLVGRGPRSGHLLPDDPGQCHDLHGDPGGCGRHPDPGLHPGEQPGRG